MIGGATWWYPHSEESSLMNGQALNTGNMQAMPSVEHLPELSYSGKG